MFTRLILENQKVLSIGARDHAIINTSMLPEITKVMKAGNWVCSCCGVRLEGMMEVDHLHGHKVSPASSMKPICQFCHDLKHPIWAASRGRLIPIFAPEISQTDLSRLSWSILVEMSREQRRVSFTDFEDSIDDRMESAFDVMGGDNLESAIESVFGIRRIRGEKKAMSVAEDLDRMIRFIPACLRNEEGVMVWTEDGFRPVDISLVINSLGEIPPMEKLSKVGNALLSA